MMRPVYLWASLLLTLLLDSVAAFAQPEQRCLRPVPSVPQLSEKWCWAASGQMAMQAMDAAVEEKVQQRIQAKRHYPAAKTCESSGCDGAAPTTPDCAHTGFPQFYKFGFEVEVTPMYKPLSLVTLWRELACRPVVFAYEEIDASGAREGTGHMMVAVSMGLSGGQWYIDAIDPAVCQVSATDGLGITSMSVPLELCTGSVTTGSGARVRFSKTALKCASMRREPPAAACHPRSRSCSRRRMVSWC